MIANLSAVSQIATGSLAAAVWQGVLLTAVVGAGFKLLPRTPAAVRFAVWFGVFLLIASLPILALLPDWGAVSSGQPRPWLTLDPRWSFAVAAIWLGASLFRAATLLWAAWRVRELWQSATHLDLSIPANDASRRARVCASDEIDRPTVIGFFSPKILIPGWLLQQLSPAEIEQIVLHESGHLGRADDWMNLLQKIGLVVFPLNPALAWVERRLCFERELACDERVLQATGAPKAYATCLTSIAEHRLSRRGLTLALGILGRESELGQRVRKILHRGESMRPLHARLLLGGTALALLVAAAGFEHSPRLVGFAAPTRATFAANAARVPGSNIAGYTAESVLFREPSHTASTPASTPHRAVAHRRQFEQQENAANNSGEMQMTVVTAYQRADGARIVLTTVRTVTPQGLPTLTGDAVAPQTHAQQQSTPHYAAVPVSGGWLVFQLSFVVQLSV